MVASIRLGRRSAVEHLCCSPPLKKGAGGFAFRRKRKNQCMQRTSRPYFAMYFQLRPLPSAIHSTAWATRALRVSSRFALSIHST